MIRIEDGDDGDGEEIVDHSEGQQKRAQRSGQVGRQHREHRKRERDVGGDRHRPSVEVFGAACRQIDPDVDGGRHHHSADGGGDRQGGTAWITQISCDELAFEFQADDEEEDRQQSVGRPRRNGQAQMQGFRADRKLRHRAICVSPWRVGPHQRGTRGEEQQDAANGFLAEYLGEALRLRPRAARQQPKWTGHGPSVVISRSAAVVTESHVLTAKDTRCLAMLYVRSSHYLPALCHFGGPPVSADDTDDGVTPGIAALGTPGVSNCPANHGSATAKAWAAKGQSCWPG